MTSQLITVDGHTPVVDDAAWIAPGAVVAGRVRLGAQTGVWYTTVVRADMESVTVGAGTSLQDGTVVHADPGFPAVIGDDVTVGHRAVVHGCTVEDSCLVGMGAVVLNGAVIGRGSLVAGVPAKVRREVTGDETAMIAASAAVYRHLLGVHRAAAASPDR